MVTRYEEDFKKPIVEMVKSVRQLIPFGIRVKCTHLQTLVGNQFQAMSSKNGGKKLQS